MTTYISNRLRDLVISRANFRCEYCLLHQDDEPNYPHEVDHVIAEKHSGKTHADNLAYACFYCNRFKGTDLASLDPLTGEITPIFNPRLQNWTEHFALDGPVIVPLTAVGRATAFLLKLNRSRIIQRRIYLIQLGHYPR
ncbi:MAG: HNH endonuclease [Chloroflexi bacterium]|nr:HNH endonuclease [Chloroflexota bacterium]